MQRRTRMGVLPSVCYYSNFLGNYDQTQTRILIFKLIFKTKLCYFYFMGSPGGGLCVPQRFATLSSCRHRFRLVLLPILASKVIDTSPSHSGLRLIIFAGNFSISINLELCKWNQRWTDCSEQYIWNKFRDKSNFNNLYIYAHHQIS